VTERITLELTPDELLAVWIAAERWLEQSAPAILPHAPGRVVATAAVWARTGFMLEDRERQA
jgi:hypothetical protein